MIIIYIIIFVISIDGITTKNCSINRLILITSCQANNDRLERINISTDHHYYFNIFNQSLSSSFLSLLPLSFCKHQQTTYYSSSGFDIFRSSPRFLFTGIANSSRNSSFHDKNDILFFINQSLSKSIIKLMSSNENNLLISSDFNKLTTTVSATTINSLLSTTTTTTAISNVSLFHTSLSTTQQGANRTFNITLLIGCISASIILIIIIIYAFVKYRNRDEGSYKIDESKNFVLSSNIDSHDNSGCRGKASSSQHCRQKLMATNEHNGIDSREWYV